MLESIFDFHYLCLKQKTLFKSLKKFALHDNVTEVDLILFIAIVLSMVVLFFLGNVRML